MTQTQKQEDTESDNPSLKCVLKTEQDILDIGYGSDDLEFFRDPSFDGCILGISHDDRPVYAYSAMVDFLIASGDCEDEDSARDFIDSDTLRSLPYHPHGPIIVFDN